MKIKWKFKYNNERVIFPKTYSEFNKFEKISGLSNVSSVALWGVFAAGRTLKTCYFNKFITFFEKS